MHVASKMVVLWHLDRLLILIFGQKKQKIPLDKAKDATNCRNRLYPILSLR